MLHLGCCSSPRSASGAYGCTFFRLKILDFFCTIFMKVLQISKKSFLLDCCDMVENFQAYSFVNLQSCPYQNFLEAVAETCSVKKVFWEICKNIFSYRTPPVAASDFCVIGPVNLVKNNVTCNSRSILMHSRTFVLWISFHEQIFQIYREHLWRS